MATDRIAIMGVFEAEDQAARAIRDLRGGGYEVERVHSTGFLTGFLLAIFTATRWHLIVQGKPVVALIPFFIVGFEFTILFSVFGNVLGLISQARLPRFKASPGYDPAFTGGHFGVLASCAGGQESSLADFFKTRGAEVRRLEAER